jgi:phytoene dehydrogenase-like protein
MINAPYLNAQNWPHEIAKMRQQIIEKVNRVLGIDVHKKIMFEAMLTPHDLEQETGSSRGSLYGMSSNSLSGAFLRQQNKSLIYKGLYFCGGSAHPGGGMPLAVLSGTMAAELVMRYEK